MQSFLKICNVSARHCLLEKSDGMNHYQVLHASNTRTFGDRFGHSDREDAMERKMEHELGLEFLRVVEAAAIASAQTMGQGERKYSDHVAVEAMRQVMDTVPMRGEIVIGEGERDEAPMLYIGEKVGVGHKSEA